MGSKKDDEAVRQLASVGDLLKQLWEFLRKHWLGLVFIFFAFLVIVFLFVIFWMLVGGVSYRIISRGVELGSFGHIDMWPWLMQSFPDVFLFLLVWLLILFLVPVYLVLWGMATLFVYLDNPEAGVKQAISTARSRAVPLLMFGLVSGLIMTLGLVLLVVPGIWFGLRFSLGQYVVVLEDKGPIKALKVSQEYVQSNYWWFIGKVLIWIIVFLELILLASLLPSMWFWLITLALVMIGQVYMYLVYRQMKLFNLNKGRLNDRT